MKKQEYKNRRRGLGISGKTLNFQHLNHTGVRRRRGRAKNWKLTWKHNERKLPQSGKGNRHTSSRSPESPKEVGTKEEPPRYITIKLAKVKDKERILKAAREKKRVNYKGVPIRLSADFSKETLQARRDWQEVFKVMKNRNYIQDYSTSKAIT